MEEASIFQVDIIYIPTASSVGLAKEAAAEVFAATVGPMDIKKRAGAYYDPELINAINAQIRYRPQTIAT
jgi:hypothetical protein